MSELMTFTGSVDLYEKPDDEQTRDIESVEHCVRHAVRGYLKAMGQHDPDGLYRYVLSEVEKPLIEEVMRWTGDNQSRAASVLGLSRNTLNKKIRTHKI